MDVVWDGSEVGKAPSDPRGTTRTRRRRASASSARWLFVPQRLVRVSQLDKHLLDRHLSLLREPERENVRRND